MSAVARPRVPDRALPWLSVLGGLALFERLPRIGVLPSRHFPPVSKTISTLADQVSQSSFWEAVGNTVQGWALGLLTAARLAIPIGIVVGSSSLASRSLRAVIELLRPIPSV